MYHRMCVFLMYITPGIITYCLTTIIVIICNCLNVAWLYLHPYMYMYMYMYNVTFEVVHVRA